MNTVKELRKMTNMSQNKFASYLEIPVANIQHWEQGVSAPPSYLIALISRVMKHDGYIKNELSPAEIDAIRQTRATLSLEQMRMDECDILEIKKLVAGQITREEYQNNLKAMHSSHEQYKR